MNTYQNAARYKNVGLDANEMRRRREEEGIQLRKQKRDQQFTKRRNINTSVGNLDDDDGNHEIDFAEACQKFVIQPETVQLLYSLRVYEQLKAIRKFCEMLSIQPNPPIDEVIETGIVPRLVELLQDYEHPYLQFEAAEVLTNITWGTSKQTQIVLEAKAIPVLVKLLASSLNNEVQEQVMCALGNIAGDSEACRDEVLKAGILTPLLKILKSSEQLGMCRNAVWTISSLCRGKSPPPDFQIVSKCLPALARIIYHDDNDVLCNACCALSYLSDGAEKNIQAVIDARVCRRLVELLGFRECNNVISAALFVVSRIVSGNDSQTQAVLNCDALPALCQLLHAPKDSIIKDACSTISNIAAGNVQQIQAIIDANIFPLLINIMKTADYKTRKEAAWAVTNATRKGNAEQIKYLVSLGCIPPICDLLTVMDADIVKVALEGLENILKSGKQNNPFLPNRYALPIEECCGLDKIEFLQSHEKMEIYLRAYRILEEYYRNDEEDAGVAPATQNNELQFTLQPSTDSGFRF